MTSARRETERGEWYLGTITNGTVHILESSLDFLEADWKYVAHVVEDTPASDYEDTPDAYRIRRVLVTTEDAVGADLARSGGQGVILEPGTEGEREAHAALE